MRALTLRRTGFLATLATGGALLGAGLGGLTQVDSTLEQAASAPRDRPVLVSHELEQRVVHDECVSERERI